MVDKKEIKKAIAPLILLDKLKGDRLYLLVASGAAVIALLFSVYLSLSSNRLIMVYIDQTELDTPVILGQISETSSQISADRYVRGFVRRYLQYHYTRADDTSKWAASSLAWVEAHSGEKGKKRANALIADFENYEEARQNPPLFYPENKGSSLKIRQNDNDPEFIYVSVMGTYTNKNDIGESFYDARLSFKIKRVPVTGVASNLGVVNVTGLIVEEATIEYVEDSTISQEITKFSIFGV